MGVGVGTALACVADREHALHQMPDVPMALCTGRVDDDRHSVLQDIPVCGRRAHLDHFCI